LDHANKVRTTAQWTIFGPWTCQNVIYYHHIKSGTWMNMQFVKLTVFGV
jgi:hypothetical protein